MKNILLLLSIISIIGLSSCGKDEEGVTLTNELNFDGTILVGKNGLISDIGVETKTPNHYTYEFGISDGTLQLSSTGNFQFQTSSDFVLTFGASSLGTSKFNNGVFEFRSAASAVPNSNFFFDATFIDIDKNSQLSVTGGTVTISGTSPAYTVAVDLTLLGGKKVTGAFIGTFEIK
jgi:hypothetical protein